MLVETTIYRHPAHMTEQPGLPLFLPNPCAALRKFSTNPSSWSKICLVNDTLAPQLFALLKSGSVAVYVKVSSERTLVCYFVNSHCETDWIFYESDVVAHLYTKFKKPYSFVQNSCTTSFTLLKKVDAFWTSGKLLSSF